jgi:hypothetical protein
MAIEPLNPPPTGTAVVNGSNKSTYEWERFFYNTYQTVSALVSASSSANLLLNGNYHYNTGVVTPVTEGDGDGAYVAEKWQVFGASSATYSIDSATYEDDAIDSNGSLRYLDVDITADTSGDGIYLYQRFTGSNFVRLIQRRKVTFSAVITNATDSNVAIQFGLYQYFDTDDELTLTRAVNLKPGLNYIAVTSEEVPAVTNQTFGASPYLEARMYIKEYSLPTQVNLQAVKAEFGSVATPIITDLFLERARIDNS